MAVHDLRCRACHTVHRDVNIPVSVGARAWCVTHRCHALVAGYLQDDQPCSGHLEPIPGIGRMSAPGAGNFQPFTLPVEDPSSPTGFRDVTVSSLHDIRRLERESEQAERNGEGRRMVWRDYSQDRSNQHVHTLAPDPSLTPAKFYSNGRRVEVRRGEPVVAEHGEIPERPADGRVEAFRG